MRLLFYRNTHADGIAKELTPEQETVWNSKIHAGGFVAHMLDAQHGKTFLQVMDATLSYSDTFYEREYTTDEILTALFELVRVGLVRYDVEF